jgi:alanyl-tRNA synthetase
MLLQLDLLALFREVSNPHLDMSRNGFIVDLGHLMEVGQFEHEVLLLGRCVYDMCTQNQSRISYIFASVNGAMVYYGSSIRIQTRGLYMYLASLAIPKYGTRSNRYGCFSLFHLAIPPRSRNPLIRRAQILALNPKFGYDCRGMNTSELRKIYIDFFVSKGHVAIPSSSLLPENDPTTLFTGSGMQPMVPFLLGQKHPLGTRIVDSQKCFRSQDIEEVGDNRHTTFFEMLGNWSLGDYFKNEQIPWMWEFLTEAVKLNPENLYFTCFKGNEELGIPRDTESAELWQKLFAEKNIQAQIGENPETDGIRPGERIFYYSEKKNWWSRSGVPQNMPVGEPGGPDTEMFYDFGVECGLHENSAWKNDPCHVNCDCGRFIEIGNNVFMEYQKTDTGFEKLQQQNVDFGGGLERIAAALNNDPDVFKIDLFDSVRTKLEEVSGKKYGETPEVTYAFRVIIDHLRAATFLMSDGVFPSNKDQGYFTRRLIRRSIRYARNLNITTNFAKDIAGAIVLVYQDAYPDLGNKKENILSEMEKEEKKFGATIQKGTKELEKILNNKKTVTGKDAFDLYQNFGFPKELTIEIAKQISGSEIDSNEYNEEFKKHQDLSRAGSEQKFKGGLADHSEMSLKYHTATHLLHAAVQKVLGPHAVQKGSNITPERLRFDFAHGEKMTPEQIKEVEDLVNAAIARDYPVSFEILPLEEAKKRGAMGLFGDKYEDMVKVYSVGDPKEIPVADPNALTFSRELCGGPHVEHTGVIGKFKITKEEAVSAGVRRIKAIVE